MICFQISIFDTIGNNQLKKKIISLNVVICFQISIFDTIGNNNATITKLYASVVICFQISIFDTIGNNTQTARYICIALWFAFKLVSLIPLETTEYMLQTNYQLVTHIFRN